ncbi:MAG: alpha/beta hydrolase family protein, partial [Luteibaculum sp.]
MKTEKLQIQNRKGLELATDIDRPEFSDPHNYILFAHCFTCGKNLNSIKILSEALTQEGFAVVRFDFTGLGRSEGDFSETDFSSELQDLEDVGSYLDKHLKAPTVLLG